MDTRQGQRVSMVPASEFGCNLVAGNQPVHAGAGQFFPKTLVPTDRRGNPCRERGATEQDSNKDVSDLLFFEIVWAEIELEFPDE